VDKPNHLACLMSGKPCPTCPEEPEGGLTAFTDYSAPDETDILQARIDSLISINTRLEAALREIRSKCDLTSHLKFVRIVEEALLGKEKP
jgi:hypothetical protein